ncbi:galectin-10-like [Physeter macrocephalus]|uniref:Galectin n=1 Tax=Physeter macrocephalus TaxID=9755 RepID=A0A455AQH2_PHYMC|nr:galectin-10-like [Physeter catodon]|eukprot:XP_028334126.1 galectin-10-like [Physeter catodon]
MDHNVRRQLEVLRNSKDDSVTGVLYTWHVSLSPGSSVTIRGKPAISFSKNPETQVDFHTGTDENSDIAFHFQVYFGISVKINNRQNGSWNCEVASSEMPFVEDQPFELHTSVLQNEYQVTVNGQKYYSLAHRLPPQSVKFVQVWREVSLSSVCVCQRGM